MTPVVQEREMHAHVGWKEHTGSRFFSYKIEHLFIYALYGGRLSCLLAPSLSLHARHHTFPFFSALSPVLPSSAPLSEA